MPIPNYQKIVSDKLIDQNGLCEVCGKILSTGRPQLAHRVPQYDSYLARYTELIIHHPKNLSLVCGLKCNASVLIDKTPKVMRALLLEIAKDVVNQIKIKQKNPRYLLNSIENKCIIIYQTLRDYTHEQNQVFPKVL